MHLRLGLAPLCLALSCTPSAPPPAAPPATAASPVATAPTPAPDPAAGIDMAACIAHAGGSKGERKQGEPPKTSCWFDAECVHQPGVATPGDGFVSIRCQNDHCACSFSRGTTDNAAGGPTFGVPDACGGGRARKLLFERCVGRPEPQRPAAE